MSCADCYTGHEHAGTPRGSETSQLLHGLPTYVSRPAGEPKGVIVYIPDLFGWRFVNNRLLCDAYAEKGGFVVYLPDLMAGRYLPFEYAALVDRIKEPASWWTTIFQKPVWVFRVAKVILPFFVVNRVSVIQARLTKFITGVRSDPETSKLKVGAAGFCWGGKYAFLLAHDDGTSSSSSPGASSSSPSATRRQPLVDCAFAAHPSMLSVPQDVERVRQPLSVAEGDTDMALSTAGIRSMETILTKKGANHEVVILDGAKHGFAVRVDPKDELQNRYAEVAERQAIAWFTRWLGA